MFKVGQRPISALTTARTSVASWRNEIGAADESRRGFLLNHLISDELPNASEGGAAGRLANADPVTGQAAWYDVRVRLRPAPAEDPTLDAESAADDATWPRPAAVPALPGTAVERARMKVLRFFAKAPERH